MHFIDNSDGPSSEGWTLRLPNDEALVLFGVLHRLNAAQLRIFEDQAEQRVLWDLEAALETVLSEIVSPAYREALQRARDRVRDATE